MGLLFIVVGVAVIAGAAMLISGRWREGLPEVPPDSERPSRVVAADVAVGTLGADELTQVRLEQEIRGYRMADVDALLDRLGAEIQARDEEIERLSGGAPRPPAPAAD